DLMKDLEDECLGEINSTAMVQGQEICQPGLVHTTNGAQCINDDLCGAAVEACASHILLEIVGIRAAPVAVDFSFPATDGQHEKHYSVPPQSTPTNAALAKRAADEARASMAHASQLFGATGTTTRGCFPSTLLFAVLNPSIKNDDGTVNDMQQPTRTVASMFANTFVEAYQLHREATLKAFDLNLAV